MERGKKKEDEKDIRKTEIVCLDLPKFFQVKAEYDCLKIEKKLVIEEAFKMLPWSPQVKDGTIKSKSGYKGNGGWQN